MNRGITTWLAGASWLVLAGISYRGGGSEVASTAGTALRSVAVTHVTVIDMTGAPPKANMTVVATGGRITTVAPSDSVTPPSGATVVDGTGKFLIPGLWDMHMHSTFDRYERSIVLPLEIANGVVGVRDMAGDCFGKCADNDTAYNPEHSPTIDLIHTWERDITAGTQVGPRMVVGSDMLNGPHPRWGWRHPDSRHRRGARGGSKGTAAGRRLHQGVRRIVP